MSNKRKDIDIARFDDDSTDPKRHRSIQDPKVAIIVPFRDLHQEQRRQAQLDEFVPKMREFLTAAGCPFEIFVIEQSDDNRKFNRGKLLNIGFTLAKKVGCDIFVFHDVDLLPSPDLITAYVTMPTDSPIHIAQVWDRYNKNPNYFGGIVAFNTAQFEQINGFPNNFWGWGGEDDELFKRISEVGLKKSPFPNRGSITDLEGMTLKEKLDLLKQHSLWKCMNKSEVLSEHDLTWKSNGLADLIFKELSRLPLGQHAVRICVNVNLNQHWTDLVCGVQDRQYDVSIDVLKQHYEDSKRWIKKLSKTGQPYWWNTVTQQSQWTDPNDPLFKSTLSTAQTSHLLELGRKASPVCQTSEPSVIEKTICKLWTKKVSSKTGLPYWWNSATGESRWEDPAADQPEQTELMAKASATDPIIEFDNSTMSSSSSSSSRSTGARRETFGGGQVVCGGQDSSARLEAEYNRIAVRDPSFPRLLSNTNIAALVARLRTEKATVCSREKEHPGFQVVFTLPDDDTAIITRAIQEEEILKTRLKFKQRDGTVGDLPSFWEVWQRSDGALKKAITEASDPHEEKWRCQKPCGYKMATTFMPGHAKGLYEYFKAKSVLDPCAGWGDRMVGAAAAADLTRYVAFDPNKNLRPGYAKLLASFGHEVTSLSDTQLQFSNGFEVSSLPFELGSRKLADNSFDFVFTSPPFFDYEMYNPENPQYRSWIEDFYVPLMQQSCRCVRPGHFVAIHIGDTSAGEIVPFLTQQVQTVCTLKLQYKIGLRGVMSGKLREVWVFQKAANPMALAVSASAKQQQERFHAKILSLTNPPISIRTFDDGGKRFTLFDDGCCIGGSKQRLLGRLIPHIEGDELIYAGPDGGMAQVALAYTARLWGKKATVFLNTSSESSKPLPKLVQLAKALGADMRLTTAESGRTLQQTQADATAYAQADPARRSLLPFGLHAKPGELYFELFKQAIKEALPVDCAPPRRLWLVGGSCFIFDVLHSIWPTTKFMLIQVGRRIWPDMIAGKNVELLVAPEKFAQTAELQPPYRTVPWYDAKLWRFVKLRGESGDAVWNVAAVPDNPVDAARSALAAATAAVKM